MDYVLAYDIRGNARRARVARRLEAIGSRSQRSVFLISAERAAIEALLRELEPLIDCKRDRIQAWRIASGDPARGLACGAVPDPRPRSAVLFPNQQNLIEEERR